METSNNYYQQQSLFRQGDVIITSIPKVGKNAERIANTHTLAEGEQTGHHHSFRAQDQVLIFKDTGNPQVKYLQVTDGEAVLEHQEHKALHIPEGTYEVKIQEEYNPFLDRMTQVHD